MDTINIHPKSEPAAIAGKIHLKPVWEVKGTEPPDITPTTKPARKQVVIPIKRDTVKAEPAEVRTTPHKESRAVEYGKQAAAITPDEREFRRRNILNIAQQGRVITKKSANVICGYEPNRSINKPLNTLIKYGYMRILDAPDIHQPLYAITPQGQENADAYTYNKDLTSKAWSEITQTEHTLGVSALMARLLSPTQLEGGKFHYERSWRAALRSRSAWLLGEATMTYQWATRENGQSLPDADALQRLYYDIPAGNEDEPLEPSTIYENADTWVIPPYLETTDRVSPITRIVDGVAYSKSGLSSATGGTVLHHFHRPDAAIIPTQGKGGGIAIELELTTKRNPLPTYMETMTRYGSAFGRDRYGLVLWICKEGATAHYLEQAAEATGTEDIIEIATYQTDTSRSWQQSFSKGSAMYLR
jgi:hypothetical protein